MIIKVCWLKFSLLTKEVRNTLRTCFFISELIFTNFYQLLSTSANCLSISFNFFQIPIITKKNKYINPFQNLSTLLIFNNFYFNKKKIFNNFTYLSMSIYHPLIFNNSYQSVPGCPIYHPLMNRRGPDCEVTLWYHLKR